jgi:hypothetical protein
MKLTPAKKPLLIASMDKKKVRHRDNVLQGWGRIRRRTFPCTSIRHFLHHFCRSWYSNHNITNSREMFQNNQGIIHHRIWLPAVVFDRSHGCVARRTATNDFVSDARKTRVLMFTTAMLVLLSADDGIDNNDGSRERGGGSQLGKIIKMKDNDGTGGARVKRAGMTTARPVMARRSSCTKDKQPFEW